MDRIERLGNPIWWLQLQLLGGGRRVAAICGGYAAVLVLATVGFRRYFIDTHTADFIATAMKILTVIQVAIAGLGGTSAIHKAVMRDHQSRMIESHRLSSMSAASAVIGYMFGPNLQVLLLYAIGALFGIFLAARGQCPATDWLLGCAYVFIAFMPLWGLAVLMGVGASKPIPPLLVLVLVGATSPIVVMFAPGLFVLTGVLTLPSGFFLMTGGGGTLPKEQLAIAATLNALLVVIWLRAAARRYRRPDRPAFDPIQALGLLAIWLIVSAVAMSVYRRVGVGTGFDLGLPQFIALLSITVFWGLHPIASAQTFAIRRARGAAVPVWGERVSSRAIVAAVVALTCVVAGTIGWLPWCDSPFLVSATFDPRGWSGWSLTAVVLAAALLTLDSLLRLGSAWRVKGATVVTLGVVALWALPSGMDLFRASYEATQTGQPPQFSWVMGCSPFGQFGLLWSGDAASPRIGFAVQVVEAALLTILASLAGRAPLTRSPPPRSEAAASQAMVP